MNIRFINKTIILALSTFINTIQAADINQDPSIYDLLALPIEQLMALRINTAVNKKEQSVKDSAAAVFVISQEDIRRSGVTNIPDALRMVPGLQVAQIDANKWAISARGFNDRFSTKLLVMIDGRTIYTPIFSGVFWHREDTPLEDVERIEVIRGAGAAMWGANAVNGVINIITKSAKFTPGALLNVGAGNQEQAFGSLRYGGKLTDDFHYRVYGKGFKRNNNTTLNHQNAQDDWENYQGGFKTDWQLNLQDSLTFQGDIYYSRTGNKEDFAPPFSPFLLPNQDSPANHKGGNLQTRWKHKISDTSETALQVYYKYDAGNWQFVTPFKPREQTLDIYFQHNFNWLEQHEIVWGLGYRYYNFAANDSAKLGFSAGHRNLQLFSSFVQDEITLLDNELKLTLGSRLEHNDFTGFEIQPNIRLMWTPDEQQSVWAAFSRAVRTPSEVSQNLKNLSNPYSARIAGLATQTLLSGNSNVVSETVLDYELGYRIQPTKKISFDVAAFYNQYNHLQAFQVLTPQIILTSSPPHIEIPLLITDKMNGETLGIELSTQWQAADWLKMQASYSFLKVSLHTPKGATFADGESIEKNAPQQQFYFKSSFNLPYGVELDGALRYVDSALRYQTPAYTTVDMRLAWSPDSRRNVEFSVVGQNLLDNHHLEFGNSTSTLPRTEIQRSVFGKVKWSF
jgi:iron complex outermembrane receptor protein